MTSEPQELKLTPDLLDYAKAVALKEAPKHCKPRLARPRGAKSDLDERPWADVVQEAILQLLRRPPKFDPARGASPKTLIYTIVQRAVIKYGTRQAKHDERYRQPPDTVVLSEGLADEAVDETPTMELITENRAAALTRSRWPLDDILQFIDNEDSRALCRLVIECDGNVSEAARRLKLSEGTVRYRLKLLEPKLRAAGFGPPTGGKR
ncbi:MAG: RNA polymerase sigma factor [Planctomycetes bacterium ADurb.Bin126]|nr:MAG: RNA polymerase sigma factor [Planctomycetes bacterium ADurb.Bin126]HOD83929.1 sigma-70 family RNA polymerase sigma factor [Phycisphaerae bacterium]HQL76228.1 sigma-70 family RNA polymerase sigma factor [Phycisphaerae bacterium]